MTIVFIEAKIIVVGTGRRLGDFDWGGCAAGMGVRGLRLVAYDSESKASLPILTRGAAAPFRSSARSMLLQLKSPIGDFNCCLQRLAARES